MKYTRSRNGGKPQLQKREAFVSLRAGELPKPSEKYSEIFAHLDEEVRAVSPEVSIQALANAHGDWYEWLLAIVAWNLVATDPNLNLAVLLPNKSLLDLASLYVDGLHKKILDLREKVERSSSVQLTSSNPDFVVVKRSLVDEVVGSIDPIESLNEFEIEKLSRLYQGLIGKCSFEEIVGYLSVKTSFRPDRRLQIPHEGSLMKAIYVHLQTREWILDPPGLKYYAMATSVGAADRESLKTVATHSITTVTSKPEPAVDEVFEVNSKTAAEEAMRVILC